MNPFTRTTCACDECVACCQRQPGPLAPGDFERIIAFLQLPRERAAEYFWASPGAVVQRRGGELQRVGTITPRFERGGCVFLDRDHRCTIHSVAPFGCAYLDPHMGQAAAHERCAWYLQRIMQDRDYRQLRDSLPPATHYAPTGVLFNTEGDVSLKQAGQKELELREQVHGAQEMKAKLERAIEAGEDDEAAPPRRQCGACTLCCKVMAVPELHKPRGAWCSHAKKKAGCACYATRPVECQAFECLWLQGLGPDDVRPDRLHAVLTSTTDGEGIVIHEDPGWPGHASARLVRVIHSIVERGSRVIVACRDSRRLIKRGADVEFLNDTDGLDGLPENITDEGKVVRGLPDSVR